MAEYDKNLKRLLAECYVLGSGDLRAPFAARDAASRLKWTLEKTERLIQRLCANDDVERFQGSYRLTTDGRQRAWGYSDEKNSQDMARLMSAIYSLARGREDVSTDATRAGRSVGLKDARRLHQLLHWAEGNEFVQYVTPGATPALVKLRAKGRAFVQANEYTLRKVTNHEGVAVLLGSLLVALGAAVTKVANLAGPMPTLLFQLSLVYVFGVGGAYLAIRFVDRLWARLVLLAVAGCAAVAVGLQLA